MWPFFLDQMRSNKFLMLKADDDSLLVPSITISISGSQRQGRRFRFPR